MVTYQKFLAGRAVLSLANMMLLISPGKSWHEQSLRDLVNHSTSPNSIRGIIQSE